MSFQPCWLDYESMSECDLRRCGSYVYAEHPSTRVICAFILYNGYNIFWTMERFNISMPVGINYETGFDFIRDLLAQPIFGIAHNVDFERPMTERCLGLPSPPGGWRDTMDQTLMRGLPAGADAAGQYLLGMGKDIEGYKLMMSTCKPRRDGTMPVLTDDVMRRYVLYNKRDVDIQKGITDLFGYDIHPETEQQVNMLHREINNRGVQLDVEFATTLKSFDESFKAEARRQTELATGGAVVGTDLTRRDFLLAWLASKGLQLSNLNADTIEKVLEADEEGTIELPTDIYAVLTNRLVVSRAALAKVETALRGVCRDGRLYALLKYWGARTGRWTGMRIQVQNMKRPNEAFDRDSAEAFAEGGIEGGIAGMSLLQLAIRAVETKDRELFEKCTIGLPPYELMSSLVRAIFIPRPGCVFVIGDYPQVEARGLLWWAEDWDGLKEHIDYDAGLGPDVYCTFASSSIYRRQITKKDKNERQAGKVGQLACGYQGGVGAVKRMAYSNGIDLAKAGVDEQTVVNAWRSKYPRVVDLWHRCDDAFRKAIKFQGQEFRVGVVTFTGLPGRVEMKLPSGRILTYMNARLEESNRVGWEGSTVIAYDSAVKGQVRREELYGGKIVENGVQAICRDLLADAMVRIDETGDEIVFHVHDEVIVEAPEDLADEVSASMQQILSTPPEWARGFPLKTKPTIEVRYGK